MYLENIHSPKDIKGLNIEQLQALAGEIREGILNRVSNHGGHVGPNHLCPLKYLTFNFDYNL